VGNPTLSPEQRADLVDKMIQTTERGGRIVEQLLSATRQATPALRPAQLNEVIEKTIYLARPALRKDITLRLELDPALPPTSMDPAQIQQVILNLLINANDAIAGPGTITLRTGTTRGTEGKTYIFASVADTGPGIDPRNLEHIFDPFFTTKPPGKGTGLGLSTSRGILELHQGSITASNLEPTGAIFTFYLPLTAQKTCTQPVQLPRSERIPVMAGPVLVADDEPLCVNVLRDTLLELGYNCLTASNGDEALALAQEHSSTIQAVITDWTMPGTHGRELVRRLRALLPNAAIIVCSGFILEDEEIPEIDSLVVKPFNPDDLIRMLGNMVAQRSAAPS
jgi:CheY-like chemotaxis protein